MGENNKFGEQSTPQPARSVSAVVVPLLGLLAVIVGLIVAWTNQNTNFGWFAYAPLSDTVFVGNGGPWSAKAPSSGWS
jgi:heme/copper-type cytochrome/quinol oxidase subunit 1